MQTQIKRFLSLIIIFERNPNITIYLLVLNLFSSDVDATKVRTILHAQMNRDSYPIMFFNHLVVDDGAEGLRFLGIEENACLHNNVDHCNIKSGEDIQYSYAAFINPRYPLVCKISFSLRNIPAVKVTPSV